jgi:hypothetical protein
MGVCCSNAYSEYDEEVQNSKNLDELIITIRRRRREFIGDNAKVKEYMSNSNKYKKYFEVKNIFNKNIPDHQIIRMKNNFDATEEAFTDIVCHLYEITKYVK